MKTLIAATLVAGSVVAVPAFSQAQVTPEYYGTLGYGTTRSDGADLGSVQGRIGAKITPHFGVEGELAGGVKDDTTQVGGLPINAELKHQIAGYAVGFLPVTPKIELLARVGYGNTKVKASAGGVSATDDFDSWSYGVGAQYKFDDKNGVRADWTKSEFTHTDTDADTLAVSYVRKF